MNKMILAMAIAAITFGGFSASAKETATKTTCPVTGTERPICDQQRKHPCPFDGINLTDAQKEQLKTMCQNRAADKKANKEAKREARSQNRREHLAKIKAILTPEQYVQYLENSYVNGRHSFKGHKNGKHHGNGRPMRNAPQGGHCPNNASCPQANQ